MVLHDLEKSSSSSKDEAGFVTTQTATDVERAGTTPEFYDPSKESLATRLGVNWESFKRAPGTTGGHTIHGENVDPLKANENPMLQQKMKPRHLQMIAVGGSIGTGLFIGSGQALRNGGPLGILLAWCMIGVMLINGSFINLAVRFLDPGFGMALGWNYFAQWAVVLPLEITAAGITVQYWPAAADVPIAAWITVFWVAIIIVNIFGTLGYAEEEFWSSCLKLAVVVIFIIIGIVLNCGGGSGTYSEYVGGRYWREPGALANGFKGICAVFVTAAFSFAGTELVGLAATETPNPRKTLPTAVKGTFWRITLIYISSLLIIGLNLPFNDERLLGGGSGAGTSPFVIMATRAGLNGLDHLINITICISVLSIGLSCVYAGSRVLTALAETGYAPKVFAYVDKSGRPLFSVIAVLLFGPIAYVNVVTAGDTVFNWLLALSGLSTLFTWGAICLCHIRFRAAWKYNGHSVDELPFKAMGGVWGSWLGLSLVVLVLIAQFYIAVWPLGGRPDSAQQAAESFFLVWLAAPILLFFWLCAYIKNRTLPRKVHEIDVDTGRKTWFTAEEMNAYRAERRAAPFYVRTYRILFTN
ncbi:amino acid transmembrane transporter [Rhodotorula toruloides]|uniref:Amino acid transmembrane transporter n=1 Tax=Rhodotorula toruloides TaxID=5286 RepID=A0A511KD50_RHOTO|nr:amino acid transmembrane transporter [Rhodotorula toruloides]